VDSHYKDILDKKTF